MKSKVFAGNQLVPRRRRNLVERLRILGDNPMPQAMKFHDGEVTAAETHSSKHLWGRPLFRSDQLFQSIHVPAIVAGLIDRRFGDKGGARQTRVVEQPAERLLADGALADVLMTIQLRSAGHFGIVAMPNLHPL